MKTSLYRVLRLLAAVVFMLMSCNLLTPQPKNAPTSPAANPTAVQNATAAATEPSPAKPTDAPAATETPAEREPLNLQIPAPSGSAADAAQRLAAALEAAENADQAAPILGEILTWAGVAIYNSEGARINTPVEPASPVSMFDFQVYGMALDYRNLGGLTLDELAQALTEAESEHPQGDGPMEQAITGELLQTMLSTWVTLAAGVDPNSWEVFIPEFLRQVNLVKEPAIDLQYTGYDSNMLRLSLLELALFATAHMRDGTPAPETLGKSGGSLKGALPVERENVCAQWNQAHESTYGKWANDGISSQTGDVLGDVWDLLSDTAGRTAGAAMKYFGKGFGWLMAAISALSGMTAWEFDIKAEPDPAHYKHNEQNDVYAEFVAHIRVNEKWPKWFADCLKTIGTEMPSNDELNQNIIRWVPIYKMPPHGEIKPENENGRMEEHFTSAGEARLKIKMWQEKNNDWETAPEKHDHMTVRGELYTDNALPGADVLISAATGDIPGAIIPILKKWFDKWFPKKAWGVMKVDYHKIVPMVFTQKGYSGGMEWTATGYNCEGIYGNWTIDMYGDANLDGMKVGLNGQLTGSLPQDMDGEMTGTMSMDMNVATAPISGVIDMPMTGALQLSGTKDAPVLVITVDNIQGSASAQGPGMKLALPLQGPGGAPYGVVIKPDENYGKCNQN